LLISRDKLSLSADPAIVPRQTVPVNPLFLNGLTGLNNRSAGLDTRAKQAWPSRIGRARAKWFWGIALQPIDMSAV
jgi:hypothetical protein